MGHLRSQEKCPLLLISYVYQQPGTSMTSSTHCSYRPIMKWLHMDLTIWDHPLTSSKEKKNMKLKKLSITSAPVGLELSNTSSNGKGTPKQITPGSQLTKSMPHTSLKPITDSTLSRIKGVKPPTRKTSTSSLAFYHVRQQPIHQHEQQIAHVHQTPLSD